MWAGSATAVLGYWTWDYASPGEAELSPGSKKTAYGLDGPPVNATRNLDRGYPVEAISDF